MGKKTSSIPLLTGPKLWFIGVFFVAWLLALGWYFWTHQALLSFSEIKNSWKIFFEWLAEHPIALCLSIGILPAFGVPISPFYILSGGLFGESMGLTLCAVGIGINLILAYLLSRYCVNVFFLKPLFKRLRVPDLRVRTTIGGFRWILIVRFIPGLPFVAQNYLLSLLEGLKFSYYFILSWAIQMLWAYGFVSGGSAWFSGKMGYSAVVILAMLALSARWVYKRSKAMKGDVVTLR